MSTGYHPIDCPLDYDIWSCTITKFWAHSCIYMLLHWDMYKRIFYISCNYFQWVKSHCTSTRSNPSVKFDCVPSDCQEMFRGSEERLGAADEWVRHGNWWRKQGARKNELKEEKSSADRSCIMSRIHTAKSKPEVKKQRGLQTASFRVNQ